MAWILRTDYEPGAFRYTSADRATLESDIALYLQDNPVFRADYESAHAADLLQDMDAESAYMDYCVFAAEYAVMDADRTGKSCIADLTVKRAGGPSPAWKACKA